MFWITKSRKNKDNLARKLYYLYTIRKQTYSELSQDYGLSKKTLQTLFDNLNIVSNKNLPIGKEIILLIDTTYFVDFGLMVFKDAHSKKIFYFQIVDYKTNQSYKEGILYLTNQGVIIKAIVSDGRRGLLGGFNGIPTQMCHFHQKAIIRRYLTKKPRLKPNQELKEITDRLTYTDKETFTYWLDEWYNKHKDWLNEKGIDKNGRKYYVHRKTRSAYYSLRRNLPYLFVYQDYWGKLDIPNTTNGLETYF